MNSKGDLISREALKEAFKGWKGMDDYYHNTDCVDIPFSEAYDLIDNAPTVDIPTELCKGCRFLKDCETCKEKLRPQGEWLKDYKRLLSWEKEVKETVYRNEHCNRAGKCIDYLGWHCAGCSENTKQEAKKNE